MSEIDKQSEQTSKTARNLLYLAGLVLAGFIGGAASGPIARSVLDAPEDVTALKRDIEALKVSVEVLKGNNFAAFIKDGDRISLTTSDGRPLHTYSTNQVLVDSRPEIQRSGRTDWLLRRY